MDIELCRILSKPNDFIICKDCNQINWYENDSCTNCGGILVQHPKYTVPEWVEHSYIFYSDEGYSDEEIEDILISV